MPEKYAYPVGILFFAKRKKTHADSLYACGYTHAYIHFSEIEKSPKIETKFLGKLGNSYVFSAQNQVVSIKKKVFTGIETDFSAEIRNSKVFSAQNQVVSKKKKRSSRKLRLIFWPKSEIQSPPAHPLATLLNKSKNFIRICKIFYTYIRIFFCAYA